MTGSLAFILAGVLLLSFADEQAQVPDGPDQFSSTPDSQQARILLDHAHQHANTDPDSSMAYARQTLEIARSMNHPSGIVKGLERLAQVYRSNYDFSKSLDLRLELLQLHRSEGNPLGEASALHHIGSIYKELGDHARGLDYYLQALRIYNRLDNSYRSALTTHSIARLYARQEREDLAQRAYRQALQLLETTDEPDYSRLAIVATSVAGFYEDLEHADSALSYYHKALAYSKKIRSPYNAHAITMALLGISAYLTSEEAHEKALAYNRQAFDLARETGNATLLALTYKNQAGILLNTGDVAGANTYFRQADTLFSELGMYRETIPALAQLAENHLQANDLGLAKHYASRAWLTVRKHKLPELAERPLTLLVKVNEASGDYAEALEYQKLYQAQRDSVLNEERAFQISKLRTLYETEKQEKEILMHKNQAAKNRNLLLLTTGGLLLVVLTGMLLYRQQRLKRQKDLALHELEQHHLHAELQHKHQELTTYTLKFVQKNRLLEQIRGKVKRIRQGDGNIPHHLLGELDFAIANGFRQDQDWKEFQQHFEQVHPDFIKSLKSRYPALTPKDLRLCALLKLNLSTKEMATLLGISPNSVKMARYRLRKKLGLQESEDLASFMIQAEEARHVKP